MVSISALHAMLRVNLIHRDISVGNILLMDRQDQQLGVLIDLEYAKPFPVNTQPEHAVRTVSSVRNIPIL